MRPLYDDGRIRCDDVGLVIGWYYLWGAQRIPNRRIRTAIPFDLAILRGSLRIWGSNDLTHWYNLDVARPRKMTGIDLDLGRHVHPCITPDDPTEVLRLITEHSPTSA